MGSETRWYVSEILEGVSRGLRGFAFQRVLEEFMGVLAAFLMGSQGVSVAFQGISKRFCGSFRDGAGVFHWISGSNGGRSADS